MRVAAAASAEAMTATTNHETVSAIAFAVLVVQYTAFRLPESALNSKSGRVVDIAQFCRPPQVCIYVVINK